MMFLVAARISRNFVPLIATNEHEKESVFKIRYEVFSRELGLEPLNAQKLERNHSDDYAIHCLMTMRKTGVPCGTIRLVSPKEKSQLLPIQEFCSDAITNMAYHPNNFDIRDICEVSRLAVPAKFRRRKNDTDNDARAVEISELGVTKKQIRMFPFISVSLYLCVMALGLSIGKRHFYVMAEPALARSMRKIGIELQQIGGVVEYHGKRAPFYINREIFFKHVKAPFRWLVRKMVKKFQMSKLSVS